MKAFVFERYGSPDELFLTDVEKPVPADEEILIRIHSVSLNGSDREALSGKPLYARMGGLIRPGRTIPGSDIAGTVESVGRNHTEFKPGDEVFGEIPGYCGGLTEYICTDGHTMALKPPGLTFQQAAAIPQAGVIAIRGIRDVGEVKPGQKVLINGAGGSAGSFAIQLAKLFGAEVTGVDNAGKLDFILSLGADHAIDYRREDFTSGGKRYDLILDLVARRSVFSYKRALSQDGTYFFVGGSVSVLLQVLIFGKILKGITGRNIRMLMVPQNRKDLISITELCESGKIVPIIDRVCPFSEFPEAMRYFVKGHAEGKVVINIAGNV